MALFSASALRDAPVRSVIEPGKYPVRIAALKKVTSRDKGTPGYEFDLELLPGAALQSNGADPSGRHIFSTLWASTDPAKLGPFLGRIKKLALSAGFDFAAMDGMPDDQAEQYLLDFLFQKEVGVKVKNEEYNGELREVIADFFALS